MIGVRSIGATKGVRIQSVGASRAVQPSLNSEGEHYRQGHPKFVELVR
jgi:hypothetical protein